MQFVSFNTFYPLYYFKTINNYKITPKDKKK